MSLRRLRTVEVYVALVTAAGLALLGFFVSRARIADLGGHAGTFVLFSLFVVIGELFPITVPRVREVEEIATSTTFAFALLLGFGIGWAAMPLAVASATADLCRRKPVWKALFNVGQYTLSVGAARGVYHALGGLPVLQGDPGLVSAGNSVAILASAATFFVVNDVLTGTALGLAQGVPPVRYLGRDFVFQAATAAALLSLSPIVIVAAERSLWLVPLFVLPVGAVYWGATVSLENTRLVAHLESSLAHMTDLNRMKDEFVAVVSHELRTPLTSIQGSIKTLLRVEGLDEQDRQGFLETIERQSDRLQHLIEQLLVVSRLESPSVTVTTAPESLQALVADVVEELRPRVDGHAFDVHVDPDADRVETDGVKLRQILSNLVENALKYSPPGTRVSIQGERQEAGVLISVEDQGPGIPPEFRDRIFDRFFQVDQSLTRTAGGTGLGLYICRRLAQTIGARLWLERTGPTGSVFSLLVPVGVGQPGARSAEPGRRDQSMTASV